MPTFFEIISCLKNKQALITNPVDIRRDFLQPHDLLSLIDSCIHHCPLNAAYDAYSKKEVSKFELLDFFTKTYGLEYKIDESHQPLSVTGLKHYYYSTGRKAQIIGYAPTFTSIECIKAESFAILAA
mgnify:CR=1 FL=1